MILKNLFASGNEKPDNHSHDSDECCGAHDVCEKLNAVQKPVQYYDDEELDVYIGRSSDSYSREETDEFTHILHTMWESDVPGWIQSLQLRGIEIPEDLRDEVLLYLS